MGMFLSMVSVIGQSKVDVINVLARYAQSIGGGIEKENVPEEHDNCCIVEEANGNTTILNPHWFLDWDGLASFISKELNAPVFSFHIHDSDLWMYVLYVNGEIADQFNPIPDYWDEDISEEEIQSWKGNAAIITQYANCTNPAAIENYLVRWDEEMEGEKKAYPDDEFTYEDYQLIDFMKKLDFPTHLMTMGVQKEKYTNSGQRIRPKNQILPVIKRKQHQLQISQKSLGGNYGKNLDSLNDANQSKLQLD